MLHYHLLHPSPTSHPLLSYTNPPHPKINDDKEEQGHFYQALLLPFSALLLPEPPAVCPPFFCATDGGRGGGYPSVSIPYLPPAIRFFYSRSICLFLTPNVLFSFRESMEKDSAPFLSSLHHPPPPHTLPPTHVEIDE